MAFAPLIDQEKQILFHDKKTEIMVKIERDEVKEIIEENPFYPNNPEDEWGIDFFTTPTLIDPGENYYYELNVTVPTEEPVNPAPTIISPLIQSAYTWEGIAQGVHT